MSEIFKPIEPPLLYGPVVGQRSVTPEGVHIGHTSADPRDALIAMLVATLTEIRNGSAETGRWLDDETFEAVDGGPDDDVPGAHWEPYSSEEQDWWHESIVAKCDDALAKVGNVQPDPVAAAAPAMLAALKLAAELVEGGIEAIWGDDKPDEDCRHIAGLAEINAAIAAAEGGEG